LHLNLSSNEGAIKHPLIYAIINKKKVKKMKVNFDRLLNNLKLFFKGAMVDTSSEVIEAAANMMQDNFMIVIFSDFLGIPNPLSYYTIELLPYFGDKLPGWEMRMSDRKSVLAKAMGEIGEP
jgi:hypothetical protein